MDVQEFLKVPQDKSSLSDKIEHMASCEIAWFVNFARTTFGLKHLPNPQPDNLIQQILPASPADISKKINGKTFYHGSVRAFEATATELFSKKLAEHLRSETSETVVKNYHDICEAFVTDAVWLLDQYHQHVANKPPIVGIWRKPASHRVEIYHAARQLFFGQESLHAFRDRHPEGSMALIREAVELRLKHAVGVVARISTGTDGNIDYITIKEIIAALRKVGDDCKTAVPLENVERVYGLASLYIHSADRGAIFAWTPLHLWKYLHPLVMGIAPGGQHEPSAGVQITRKALLQVRRSLREKVGVVDDTRSATTKKRWKLARFRPEVTLLKNADLA